MRFGKSNLWIILILVLPALAYTFQVEAQTFTTLYSFTNFSGGKTSLILSSNILFGTSGFGGTASNGAVFKVNTDGTGFTNLYSFTATVGSFPALATNSDGANPDSGLTISGNTLYGTAWNGGSLGSGTVFAVNTDGSGFTNLHPFANADGAQPNGLLLSSNILYGTTRSGGESGAGTVFKLNTDGTAFTNLHSFNGGNGGLHPQAGLVISGIILYGTVFSEGSAGGSNPNNGGTVFAINTDGTGFTNLYNFTGGSDGGNPQGVLVFSSNMLYGTTMQGGSLSNGTLFAVNTDGTGFTNLHNFTGGDDGSGPPDGLILFGNTLYGTTAWDGTSSYGTVFAVNTDGTGFTTLHSFSATNSDGAPSVGLLLSGNILYGTTGSGGNFGQGTVFSVSLLPPQLGISQFASKVILTWPTYAPGVTLQSSTNLAGQAVWNNVSPAPVLVNGQNTVTNPNSGPLLFYRLSQ